MKDPHDDDKEDHFPKNDFGRLGECVRSGPFADQRFGADKSDENGQPSIRVDHDDHREKPGEITYHERVIDETRSRRRRRRYRIVETPAPSRGGETNYVHG